MGRKRDQANLLEFEVDVIDFDCDLPMLEQEAEVKEWQWPQFVSNLTRPTATDMSAPTPCQEDQAIFVLTSK